MSSENECFSKRRIFPALLLRDDDVCEKKAGTHSAVPRELKRYYMKNRKLIISNSDFLNNFLSLSDWCPLVMPSFPQCRSRSADVACCALTYLRSDETFMKVVEETVVLKVTEAKFHDDHSTPAVPVNVPSGLMLLMLCGTAALQRLQSSGRLTSSPHPVSVPLALPFRR